MDDRSAYKFRRLVDAGDRLLTEIERAERIGDRARAERLRKESKEIDAAIAAVKTEAAENDELAVLRSRASDSENALDAFLEALKKAERWRELARVAETEIERLMAIKQRTPEQKARLKKVVDLHNEATDAG